MFNGGRLQICILQLYNFRAVCLASNTSRPFRYEVPESKPHTDDVTVVGAKPRPRPVKPHVNQNDEIQIVQTIDPVPSTSQASASCFYGARPKKRAPKPPQQTKKPKYSRPQVTNMSPADNSYPPELVLEILDSERFSEVEVLDGPSGSSDEICVMPSPTYKPNTSDSSEPSTKRYSPVYQSLSDYEYPSPYYGPLECNPLAYRSWSDSD